MIRSYDTSNISLHFFSPYAMVRRRTQNHIILHHHITGNSISITGDERWLDELTEKLCSGCEMDQLLALFQLNDSFVRHTKWSSLSAPVTM